MSALWGILRDSQTRNPVKDKPGKDRWEGDGGGRIVNDHTSPTASQHLDRRGVASKKRKLLRHMPIEWDIRE